MRMVVDRSPQRLGIDLPAGLSFKGLVATASDQFANCPSGLPRFTISCA